jgi:hypothetical protein
MHLLLVRMAITTITMCKLFIVKHVLLVLCVLLVKIIQYLVTKDTTQIEQQQVA